MIFPLVGNTKIKQSVLNFIKENRLPHAILIEGDKGTGRHTLANFISLAAVCEGENAPCSECSACKKALSLNHPDISVTAPEDKKKSIAVDQIRALKNETNVKPHLAKRRVFIIDFADTLNENSQNALLKVLEEPPGSVMFILIAESKASLLETILSRCVCLTLSTPEENLAIEYIKNNSNFQEEDIKEALSLCSNNIGRALLMLSGKENSETNEDAKRFLKFMLEGNSFGMLEATIKAEKNRLNAAQFIKELKNETVCLLKQNLGGYRASALSRFYDELSELEKSLVLNINLPLLFAALTSKAAEIIIINKR